MSNRGIPLHRTVPCHYQVSSTALRNDAGKMLAILEHNANDVVGVIHRGETVAVCISVAHYMELINESNDS